MQAVTTPVKATRTAARMLAATALLSAAGLLAVPYAQARDEKVFAGSVCKPNREAGEYAFAYVNGSILRVDSAQHPTDGSVTCVIPRDNKNQRWLFAYVRVTKNTNTDRFTCTAMLSNSSGRTVAYRPAQIDREVTGLHSIRTSAPSGTSHVGGMAAITCRIPPNGTVGFAPNAIHSIRVAEVDE